MAEKKTRRKLSRREFLKDAAVLGGAVVGGGVMAGYAPATPAAAQTPVPPTVAPTPVSLTAAPAVQAVAPTEFTTFDTDVLVIGAGVAGTEAACAAARAGANVIIVDKKKFGRCGDSGVKSSAQNTSSWMGIQGDSVDVHLQDVEKTGYWIVDEKVGRAVVQASADDKISLKSENYGNIHMRDDKGRPVWVMSMSKPRSWCGYKLHNHAFEALRLGVKVLDYTMATKLLTDQTGAVVGATAIHFKTGEFYVIRAKSTVLATGGDTQIFGAGTTGCAHTSTCYGLTGDGHAMAAPLGVEFKDLEFHSGGVNNVYGPLNFNLLTGGSTAEMMDKNGKKIMEGISAEDLTTRRAAIEIYKAITEGRASPRGGVFGLVNTSNYAEEGQGADAFQRAGFLQDGSPTFGQWPLNENAKALRIWQNKGFDVTKELVEMTGGYGYDFGGVVGNEKAETGIPGLYAAGETSMHSGAGYMAFRMFSSGLVVGNWAGTNGAARAKVTTTSIDRSQVAKEYSRVFGILYAEPATKLRMKVVRDKVQDAAWKGAGMLKSDKQCADALAILDSVEKDDLPKMYVADKSKVCNMEWMEALETINMITMARMDTLAARTRTESRGFHLRNEYPDMDNDNWLKNVIIKMVDGKFTVTTRPVVATAVKAPPGKIPQGGGTIQGL